MSASQSRPAARYKRQVANPSRGNRIRTSLRLPVENKRGTRAHATTELPKSKRKQSVMLSPSGIYRRIVCSTAHVYRWEQWHVPRPLPSAAPRVECLRRGHRWLDSRGAKPGQVEPSQSELRIQGSERTTTTTSSTRPGNVRRSARYARNEEKESGHRYGFLCSAVYIYKKVFCEGISNGDYESSVARCGFSATRGHMEERKLRRCRPL